MTSHAHDSIQHIVSDTISVIDTLSAVSTDAGSSLDDLKQICSHVPDQINSSLLRVAVVGAIKSGKSTFINALTGKELVQRGAGVVTSITTRIRKGKKNRAIVHLKSWDDINKEIRSCLALHPEKPADQQFDIRRSKDRSTLKSIYNTFSNSFPVTSKGVRPQTLLIRNALEGYDRCADLVASDEHTIHFDGKAFENHKEFTADPAKAFYIRDICLEVYGKTIGPDMEMADCQGADSTDPAVMAKILSYLESAHLIIYCISSRTGLRQADMAFLKQIKRLGLMENILFIYNCDLSEHDNLTGLNITREKTCQDLCLLTEAPLVFSFSALYVLFDALESKLSAKNRKRLALWQEDGEMAAYCTKEYERFFMAYNRLFKDARFQLSFANPVQRLKIVSRDVENKTDLLIDVLSKSLLDQDKARTRLTDLEDNARRLRVIVDNSVKGAVSALRREIELNLKNVFLKDSENINKLVTRFVRQAKIDYQPYKAGVSQTGLKHIIYLMFQDFKRDYDLFILEQITPELKRLVSTQEGRIEAYFKSLLDSYRIDYVTMAAPADKEERQFSLEMITQEKEASKAVDLEGIKKILGLRLPSMDFSLEYTSGMRANALTDFSLHSLVMFISAMVDRHARFSFSPGLDRAAAGIKKKSLMLIRRQIKTWHLSLKNDYFFPMIDAATRDFKDKILQRFTMYETLNKDMDALFSLKQEQKKQHLYTAHRAKDDIIRIRTCLDELSRSFLSEDFKNIS